MSLAPCQLEAAELDPPELDAAELVALEASLQRDSFADFVIGAWPLLEPNGRPFVRNVATDALMEHLQAVGDGKLRRLLVAVPPGTGKSTLCSVAFAPWLWSRDPARRVIHASHAHDLAVTLSRRARRLVESPWYRDRFGIELRADQNRADDFENVHSGRRLAVGVGGALLGQRSDAAVVDDSLSGSDARSKATREATNDWFDTTLTTRLDDADRAAIVVVQQRLHSNDLIGHLLEAGTYEALILPAEFDSRRRSSTSIGWRDPRRKEAALLAPKIHSAEFLAEQRRTLGSAGYSCVYQQSPTDDEGGIFLRDWWRFHRPDGTAPASTRRPRGCSDAPAIPTPDKFERLIVSCDLAVKDGAANDYSVALVAGIVGAQRFILDMRRVKLDFTKICKLLEQLADLHRGATFLVEDAASGPQAINVLSKRIPNLIAVRAAGSKEQRAAACSPAVEAQQVFLPEGAPWLGDFIEECASFPRGRNDDAVDALSQLLNYCAGAVDGDFERKRRDFIRNLMLCSTGNMNYSSLDAMLANTPYGPARETDLPAFAAQAERARAAKAAKRAPMPTRSEGESTAAFNARLLAHVCAHSS